MSENHKIEKSIAPFFSARILKIKPSNVDQHTWEDYKEFIKNFQYHIYPLINDAIEESLKKKNIKSLKTINDEHPVNSSIFFDGNKFFKNDNDNKIQPISYIYLDTIVEEKYPSWVHTDPYDITLNIDWENLVDKIHHLLIINIHPPYIFIQCSKETIESYLYNYFISTKSFPYDFLFDFERVSNEQLELAFVYGDTMQIWLSGLHKRVETKPDKKALSGQNLKQALDPLGDQSYYYTAITSTIKGSKSTRNTVNNYQKELGKRDVNKEFIGFSKKKKKLWMTKSKNLRKYALKSKLISDFLNLHHQDKSDIEKNLSGIKYLSKELADVNLSNLKNPFEIYLDYEDKNLVNEDIEEIAQDWQLNGEFIPKDGGNNDEGFVFEVKHSGLKIAEISIILHKITNEQIGISIDYIEEDNYDEEYRRFRDLMQRNDFFKPFTIRFDSGHVLQGDQLFMPNYQDVFFPSTDDNWKFMKHKKTDRWEKEKPKNFIEKGISREERLKRVEDSKSLFGTFIHNLENIIGPTESKEWYCICDDGANEVADFVYIEPETMRIDLVHVKGANSKEPNRKISITAYEVVCQQAVKNLRHANLDILLNDKYNSPLNNVDKAKTYAYFMRSSNEKELSHDCTPFFEALKSMHSKKQPFRKKNIWVYQPHIRKTLWEELERQFENRPNNENEYSNDLRKALMLSTILYETKIACLKQQATFRVISDDDTEKSNKETKALNSKPA